MKSIGRIHCRQFSTNRFIRNQGYINGVWCDALSGKTFQVEDPGNGNVIGNVALMGEDDMKKAIDCAESAWNSWKMTTGKERSSILKNLVRLHYENVDDLADLLAQESGKPLAEAKGEILYSTSYFEWFAEEAKRMYGDTIPSPFPGRRIITRREPVGVCFMISPWNFPSAMIGRKIGPALAAGCTMIIKPATETPLSTLAIAELAEKAGVPKGVLNVVPTHSDETSKVGKIAMDDERIRKITFTGSTNVGKLLIRQSAETVKKISMELGGNAPFIVFENSDLDKAVDGLIASKFRNAGQTCVCPNRTFVQQTVYDEFAKKLTEKVENLNIGYYSDKNVQVGPLINPSAADKMEQLVKDAVDTGATILTGGSKVENMPTTNYFQPTVLGNVGQNARVAKEEIFGPIIPLFSFETEQQAIQLANNTNAGLAAYFYSENLEQCFRVSEQLESGMVGVNTGVISAAEVPFGGVKSSGSGKEGSKYGLDDYTILKYINI